MCEHERIAQVKKTVPNPAYVEGAEGDTPKTIEAPAQFQQRCAVHLTLRRVSTIHTPCRCRQTHWMLLTSAGLVEGNLNSVAAVGCCQIRFFPHGFNDESMESTMNQ